MLDAALPKKNTRGVLVRATALLQARDLSHIPYRAQTAWGMRHGAGVMAAVILGGSLVQRGQGKRPQEPLKNTIYNLQPQIEASHNEVYSRAIDSHPVLCTGFVSKVPRPQIYSPLPRCIRCIVVRSPHRRPYKTFHNWNEARPSYCASIQG